ncbi:mannitol dehydrogenase [Clostridia bacterium]|nr:mannitol dehydrogenase [Clostridia bacterium]
MSKWLHFGAGNIFRGYIAALADTIGEKVIAAETFDTDIIEKIYKPFNNRVILVTLKANGSTVRREITSIAEATCDTARLREIFLQPELQMVSFTITEKGYAGPLMPLLAELLRARFEADAAPLALVSMDNCSQNGKILREAVMKLADGDFASYLDEKVSFPWSMIDKITPRPAESVRDALEAGGIENMDIIVTSKGTYIAPFVNAEAAEYLVIEDDFPNGRPPLEKAGVYFTDRETVGKAERMKVTTCLNPLHTALAVFGCLLGYKAIWKAMRDPDLVKLVKKIGYDEGLPVVTHPGIFEPRDFLDEVVNERLPNPFIPDTPQRIATDTSQKIPIRFGETIKAYQSIGGAYQLIGIPLAIAGWLRYRDGLDDGLNPMEISPDPAYSGEIREEIAGLLPKITEYYNKMQGKGAVRALLREVLQ